MARMDVESEVAGTVWKVEAAVGTDPQTNAALKQSLPTSLRATCQKNTRFQHTEYRSPIRHCDEKTSRHH